MRTCRGSSRHRAGPAADPDEQDEAVEEIRRKYAEFFGTWTARADWWRIAAWHFSDLSRRPASVRNGCIADTSSDCSGEERRARTRRAVLAGIAAR